jgi:hypothetical protein
LDLFLAICQGIGLALAAGIGGPVAALFVATMAHVDLGMSADGTDVAFFASNWFVAILIVVAVASFLFRDRAGARLPLLAVAVLVGALAFGASLGEEGESVVPGILAGALVAAGAGLLASSVLAGASRRAAGRSEAASADATLLTVFAAAGILVALLALFLPPTALLALVALAILAGSRRRRAGEKYEGLRVLR